MFWIMKRVEAVCSIWDYFMMRNCLYILMNFIIPV